jgi:Zn-dependent protease with chaperone function
MNLSSAIVLVVLSFNVLFGQSQRLTQTYRPSSFIDTIPGNLLKDIKARSVHTTAEIHHPDRKVEAKARQLSKKSSEYVINLFNSDQITTDEELSSYTENLVRLLESKSGFSKEETLVFVSGNSSVNALSASEGVIVCNAGLISRLHNEAQMAFVLAHELSHYYLRHVQKSIVVAAEIELNPGIKKDIRSIKRNEINQYSRMNSLMRSVRISFTQHSREHELEADSLAVIQMMKSGYNVSEAVNVLRILDSADVSLNRKIIDLRSHFYFKDYPFKKEWLNYVKSSMYHVPKLKDDTDSTKTHPDCKQRIAAVSVIINTLLVNNAAPNSKSISYLRNLSEFEQIDSEFHSKHYGRSLFLTLLQLDLYPDNIYLHSMIGRNLYEIHQSLKGHYFSRVVDLPNDQFDENYNRLIAFIHQLRTNELGSLAYYYMTSRNEVYFEDENFLFAFWQVSRLPSSKLDSESIKADYLEKFPSGRFIKQLK